MLAHWLLLFSGLALLTAGADFFVRSSSRTAARLNISPLIIGLTLVSFGTSLPEFIVSLRASLIDQPGIAIGNVVGSNICNIGLILGIAALIQPLRIQISMIRNETPFLLLASGVFIFFLLNSILGRMEAAVLILLFAFYLSMLFRQSRNETVHSDFSVPGLSSKRPFHQDIIVIVLGLAGLFIGSRLFLNAGIRIALHLGISETVVGLTMIALGTSLPELAATFAAALRKEADIAVGNIIGSNIFNILAISGICGAIHPLKASDIAWTDLAVMGGLTIVLLPLMRTGFILKRWEGGVLLLSYIGYQLFLFLK